MSRYPTRKVKENHNRILGQRKRIGNENCNIEKEEDCVICLEKIQCRGRLAVCSHWFCFVCIYEWAKSTNTCPLCKERFRCITKVSLLKNGSPPRQYRVMDRDQKISNTTLEDYEAAMALEDDVLTTADSSSDEDYHPRSYMRFFEDVRPTSSQIQRYNTRSFRNRFGEQEDENRHKYTLQVRRPTQMESSFSDHLSPNATNSVSIDRTCCVINNDTESTSNTESDTDAEILSPGNLSRYGRKGNIKPTASALCYKNTLDKDLCVLVSPLDLRKDKNQLFKETRVQCSPGWIDMSQKTFRTNLRPVYQQTSESDELSSPKLKLKKSKKRRLLLTESSESDDAGKDIHSYSNLNVRSSVKADICRIPFSVNGINRNYPENGRISRKSRYTAQNPVCYQSYSANGENIIADIKGDVSDFENRNPCNSWTSTRKAGKSKSGKILESPRETSPAIRSRYPFTRNKRVSNQSPSRQSNIISPRALSTSPEMHSPSIKTRVIGQVRRTNFEPKRPLYENTNENDLNPSKIYQNSQAEKGATFTGPYAYDDTEEDILKEDSLGFSSSTKMNIISPSPQKVGRYHKRLEKKRKRRLFCSSTFDSDTD